MSNSVENYKCNKKLFVTITSKQDPVSYTHLDVYKRQVYNKLMWNKPINEIVKEYKSLDKYYIILDNNIISLLKNKLYRPKIRTLFNDGG